MRWRPAKSASWWASPATSSRRKSALQEAKNGVDIAYAIPQEGDAAMVRQPRHPADAKNVAEALAFINYLQKPEVAAKNSNFISYANGNLASQKFIDKSILDDKSIYPDDATMKRLYTITAHDPKIAAADEPAVDQDQDRKVAAVTASAGAATAIAPGARAPSLRPPT